MTTAPQAQDELRQTLARCFDDLAFYPRCEDDYWKTRRRTALRRADHLLTGPLAPILTDLAAARETIARQAGEIARLRAALRPFLAIRCSFDGFGFEPADLYVGNTRVGSISSADHQKLQGMLDDAHAALTPGAPHAE